MFFARLRMRGVLAVSLGFAALAFSVLAAGAAQANSCPGPMSTQVTQTKCNNGWFSGSARHSCTDRDITVPTAGCCKIRARCERWEGDSEGNWSAITVTWPKAQNVVNCHGTLKLYPCP